LIDRTQFLGNFLRKLLYLVVDVAVMNLGQGDFFAKFSALAIG